MFALPFFLRFIITYTWGFVADFLISTPCIPRLWVRKVRTNLLLCTEDDNSCYRNVCKMSVVSFALAVVFIIRLFSTSAFRVPKWTKIMYRKSCFQTLNVLLKVKLVPKFFSSVFGKKSILSREWDTKILQSRLHLTTFHRKIIEVIVFRRCSSAQTERKWWALCLQSGLLEKQRRWHVTTLLHVNSQF